VILYLDASALVKRYVREPGSKALAVVTAEAAAVAPSLVSRAEVAAAFARAVRGGILDARGGRQARSTFAREWPHFIRIPVTEALVSRAEALAWDHGLRGYDAIQLSAALTWQDSVGQDVVLATFDRQLWETTPHAGLQVWPRNWPSDHAR
jgi:predicted nucleic acid-binding protein